MTTIERDTKMLWQSFYDHGLKVLGLSPCTAVAHANAKMENMEARAIEAALNVMDIRRQVEADEAAEAAIEEAEGVF